MRVLGIETSCDETAAAVYDSERGLLAHRLYSQVELHAEYGGVVPELASRDHIRKLLPIVDEVLSESNSGPDDIDGIAYTAGPGLIGALMVGTSFGRSLAWSWGKPAVAVHHMEGHLLAPMLEDNPPPFPFVALLVSGGHSQLVDVRGVGDYRLMGESVDDAAGEAFDKTAKLLDLPYPGGPALSRLAESGRPDRYRFPRPMTDRPGLDMSFSGLKTFALNTLKDAIAQHGDPLPEQIRADIALAFEQALVETLAIKCRRAIRESGHQRLILAGGVSANTRLRSHMREIMEKEQIEVRYPRLEFCTDNGAMIAYAGWQRLRKGAHENLSFRPKPRWPLNE